MDFEDIKNMKDLQEAITPTKKETKKIWEACSGLARDGIATAYIMPKLRDELINVGAQAIDNMLIVEFAKQIRKNHKEEPKLREQFCKDQNISEDEFDLMVIGLFQIGVWLNLTHITKKRLSVFLGDFASHLRDE